jgi:DNA-binding NarL/FixJ family response regulator
MAEVRILLVDDVEVWRWRIGSILATLPELQVVGEASDGLEAVQKAEDLKPDLILLETGLPHLNGIEAERRIHEVLPSAKVVFVSRNNDSEIISEALGHGALGFVLKTDVGSELLPAIEAIISGEGFISSGIEESIS